MFELIRPDTNFDFASMMKAAVIASVVFILIGIASIFYHGGLNLGVDFAGGAVVQLKFQKEVATDRIREALDPVQLENSVIQQFGTGENREYLIRTSETAS